MDSSPFLNNNNNNNNLQLWFNLEQLSDMEGLDGKESLSDQLYSKRIIFIRINMK